jgi:hypothetical protein
MIANIPLNDDLTSAYCRSEKSEIIATTIEDLERRWPFGSLPPQAAKLFRTSNQPTFPAGALFAGSCLVGYLVEFTGR